MKYPRRKRSQPRDRHLRGVVTPVVPTRARTTRVRALQSRTRAGAPDHTLRRRALAEVTPRPALVLFAAQLRRVVVVSPGQAGTLWQLRQAAVQVRIWGALALRLEPSLRQTRHCLLRLAVTMQNPHRLMAGVPRRPAGASTWESTPLQVRL